jgi:hypothetical protein
LHIYFVIFIYHPHNSHGFREHSQDALKIEQAEFKKYLDNAGSELSKTSEFLAFYALPYIPNPMDHPSFKSLFTMEWVNQLKQELKSFIHERAFELGLNHLGQQNSLIFNIFLRGQGESIGSNDEMSERMLQMQKTMVVLQKKEHFAKKTLYES